MSSHFIANQLYTETEIKDYIMNCDSKHHKAVYEAIVSYGQETEQYIMPFQDWIKEFDDKERRINGKRCAHMSGLSLKKLEEFGLSPVLPEEIPESF